MKLRQLSDIPVGYKEWKYHNIKEVDDQAYAIIFLDGREIDIAVEANKEEGWVKCIMFNSNKNPVILKNKEIAYCILKGDVVIVALGRDGKFK